MTLRCSFVFLALVVGCRGSLPQPVKAASPEEAYVEVPYPPPAALCELIPPRPKVAGAVFLDGGWTWRGGYYVWRRGGWVVPKPGQRNAPWSLKYTPDGRAFFAETRWVDERGQLVRAPQIIEPSSTPPNEVTAEFQTGR